MYRGMCMEPQVPLGTEPDPTIPGCGAVLQALLGVGLVLGCLGGAGVLMDSPDGEGHLPCGPRALWGTAWHQHLPTP